MSTIEVRRVPSNHGVQWVKESWGLYKKAPLQFFLWLVAYFACAQLLQFIPIIGFILSFIASVVLGSGIYRVVQVLDQTGEFRWNEFTTRFQTRTGAFFIYMCMVVLIMIVALGVVVGIIAFGSKGVTWPSMELLRSGDASSISAFFGAFGQLFSQTEVLLGFVLGVTFSTLFMFSQSLGPVMILLTDARPLDVLVGSIRATFINFGAFLIYGLIALLALPLVAIFTLFLGFIVLFPLLTISYYLICKDMILAEPPATTSVEPHVFAPM